MREDFVKKRAVSVLCLNVRKEHGVEVATDQTNHKPDFLVTDAGPFNIAVEKDPGFGLTKDKGL